MPGIAKQVCPSSVRHSYAPPVINDRLIDPDSLVLQPGKVTVGVRIPWYRAIPASCIHDVTVSVDGEPVPSESIVCELNGRPRRLEEFPELVDESWFTTDPLTVSGDLDLESAETHDVHVNLKLFIPYIVTAHGVLMIDESLELQMAGTVR
jgi:hypothetical protein